MPSDAQQRMTQTLTFLQNTTLVTAPERTPAYQLAQDFINAAYPNPALPAYTQFSDTLSLGFHLGSDPNEHRKMARALFLLWKAIKHNCNTFPMPLPNVGQINQGTASRALTNYIRKARCVYDIVHAGNGGASHVLTQVFQANPLQFLTDNNVFVAGAGTLDPAQAPQNIQACTFKYEPQRDRFEFRVRGIAENGAANIQVESVTAFHWTDGRYGAAPPIATANFNNMTGIELSGLHPMVTTQFTGCSFCMAEHGAHMYCSHVSPFVQSTPNNTDGHTLAPRVIATGAFANAGGVAVRVFGRNFGSPPNSNGYDIAGGGGAGTYMTIVGFPGGATYHIYSQTTQNNVITDHLQIF